MELIDFDASDALNMYHNTTIRWNNGKINEYYDQ